MATILKKILPRALQATGSPTDLESTWAQQEALPPSVAADKLLSEAKADRKKALKEQLEQLEDDLGRRREGLEHVVLGLLALEAVLAHHRLLERLLVPARAQVRARPR